MSVDSTKKWQRNIRVDDDLWGHVKQMSVGSNYSAFICKLIKTHRRYYDTSVTRRRKRAERRQAQANEAARNDTQVNGSPH